jgi:hypothetical protein
MKNGLAVLAMLLVSRTAVAADAGLPILPAGTVVRILAPKTIDIPGILSATEGRTAWSAPEIPGDHSRLAAKIDAWPEVMAVPQPGGLLHGTIVSVDAAGLVVTLDARKETVRIPKEAVARLDVRRGSGSRGTHALIGAAVGLGLTGALVGFAGANCQAYDCGRGVAVGGVFYGAVLGLSGALVGAILPPGDRWEEVPRGKVFLSLGPAGHGLGLRASLRF